MDVSRKLYASRDGPDRPGNANKTLVFRKKMDISYRFSSCGHILCFRFASKEKRTIFKCEFGVFPVDPSNASEK